MKIYCFLVHVPDNLVPVVFSLDHYSRPICVQICAQVISYAHILHGTGIYI